MFPFLILTISENNKDTSTMNHLTTQRYLELLELCHSFEKDFVKFYEKGNKTAGIRLRKHMQTLRTFAVGIRNEVQDMNKTDEENDS